MRLKKTVRRNGTFFSIELFNGERGGVDRARCRLIVYVCRSAYLGLEVLELLLNLLLLVQLFFERGATWQTDQLSQIRL